jgi:hypothetical protein
MRKLLTLLAFQAFFCSTVMAQSVTFTGAITRHAETDKNVAVSGQIYFVYGTSDTEDLFENSVALPFSIPAGQRAVVYEKTLDWALAGSTNPEGTYPSHNFFRVIVECQVNCQLANIQEAALVVAEGDITANYRYNEAERFGENERAGGYVVNPVLLPRYAHINGNIKLPSDTRLTQDLTLKLVSLDFGSCCYGYWIYPQSQPVTIPAGQTQIGFRYKVDIENLAAARTDHFRFGYLCDSALCDSLGLIKSGFLDADGNRLYTHRGYDGSEAINLDISKSDDAFRFDLPTPLVLGKKSPLKVIASRLESTDLEEEVIGKLIVERHTNYFACGIDAPSEINFESANACFDYQNKTRTEIVSSADFQIDSGELSSDPVILSVEYIDQLINPWPDGTARKLDHQRIKFVCESGCSSSKLRKEGYYREGTKYSAPGVTSATKFLLSSQFEAENRQITLPLSGYIDLTAILMLLEED